MALFGTQRDAKFLASINAELLNSIIDTEIEFYKLVVEQSNTNIYGESVSKTYFDSILIPALITKETKKKILKSGEDLRSGDVFYNIEYFMYINNIFAYIIYL